MNNQFEPDNQKYLQCSWKGCQITFSENFFSSGDSSQYSKILSSLLQTRLFCLKHCQLHTKNICSKSGINYK